MSSCYHSEVIGTIRGLTSAAQAVTDSYIFDAWGTDVSLIGATLNPFRYVGKQGYYTDASSGLSLLGVRLYLKGPGRFLSADPQADGPNLYLYAKANPTMFTDPSGLKCRKEAIGFNWYSAASYDVKENRCGALFGYLCAGRFMQFHIFPQPGSSREDIADCAFIQWVKGQGLRECGTRAVLMTTRTNCSGELIDFDLTDWVVDSANDSPFYANVDWLGDHLFMTDAVGFAEVATNCWDVYAWWQFKLDVVHKDDITTRGWRCKDLKKKARGPDQNPYLSLVKARQEWNVQIKFVYTSGLLTVSGQPQPSTTKGCQ